MRGDTIRFWCIRKREKLIMFIKDDMKTYIIVVDVHKGQRFIFFFFLMALMPEFLSELTYVLIRVFLILFFIFRYILRYRRICLKCPLTFITAVDKFGKFSVLIFYGFRHLNHHVRRKVFYYFSIINFTVNSGKINIL